MATEKEIKAAARATKKLVKERKEKEEAERLAKFVPIGGKQEVTPEPVKEVVKTKKEVQLDEIQAERELVESLKRKERVRTNKEEWDVKIGEEIDHFDPELSYELTGYRPISMTRGLDFDPLPFTQAGRIYEETGKYSTFLEGSKLYNEFWDEQYRRCVEGFTVGKYTVTGDNYFWLNFYRLPNTKNVSKAGGGRLESFPDFFSKQYEYFHYIDLCERIGKDVGALKARAVGFSEIAACLGVRVYTTTKNSKCLYTASSDKFIKDVLDKAWLQLEFLNAETQGGMKHVRMKKDTDILKRASKVTRDGSEFGHMATIQGVVADTARKLRGGRVERLLFEESGSNPILVTAYNQSEALVEVMGNRIGTRFIWGTGTVLINSAV